MKSLFIKRINQKNNYTFSVEWQDGKVQDFRLSTLQRLCSCANCRDEHTGERLIHPNQVKDDVRAVAIRSVGRYALRIQFTSGCSTGIYSFDMLRNIKE